MVNMVSSYYHDHHLWEYW